MFSHIKINSWMVCFEKTCHFQLRRRIDDGGPTKEPVPGTNPVNGGCNGILGENPVNPTP